MRIQLSLNEFSHLRIRHIFALCKIGSSSHLLKVCCALYQAKLLWKRIAFSICDGLPENPILLMWPAQFCLSATSKVETHVLVFMMTSPAKRVERFSQSNHMAICKHGSCCFRGQRGQCLYSWLGPLLTINRPHIKTRLMTPWPVHSWQSGHNMARLIRRYSHMAIDPFRCLYWWYVTTLMPPKVSIRQAYPGAYNRAVTEATMEFLKSGERKSVHSCDQLLAGSLQELKKKSKTIQIMVLPAATMPIALWSLHILFV